MTCSICIDLFSVPVVTPCGHLFCYKCLFKWIKSKTRCPQCRNRITTVPYPCFLMENLVEELLLKFPDQKTQDRIQEDRSLYKSLKKPWNTCQHDGCCNLPFGESDFDSYSGDEEFSE